MTRSRLLPFITIFLLFSLVVPGVLAQWTYFGPPDPVEEQLETDLVGFVYGMIYITEITYNGSDTDMMTKTGETTADVRVTLPSNASASRSIEVTFYNSTDVSYYYDQTETVSQNNANITYTVSGINQKDEIPAKSHKTIAVTFAYSGNNTSSTSLVATLNFKFVVDKSSIGVVAAQTAVQRFADILNNKTSSDSYSTLITAMNNRGSSSLSKSYIGNVAGAKDADSQAVETLFTEEFLTMDLDGDGNPEPITLMIKRENLDDNNDTGDSYPGFLNIQVRGNEMTIYITAEGFTNSSLTVYATTFTKMPGSSEWVMIVPLTKGTADANKYTITDRQNNSFNTGTWRDENGKDMGTLVKNAMK